MTSWFRSNSNESSATNTAATLSVKEAVKGLSPPGNVDATLGRDRFSPLLLEHGEHLLQDWAVTASSRDASSTTTTSGGAGNSGKGGGKTSSSSGRTEWNKSGRNKSSSSNKKRVGPSPGTGRTKAPPPSASNYPTCNMIRMEGRLHLCSRSIVFEPMDPARAIVRCPLIRMKEPPIGSSSSKQGTSSRTTTTSSDLATSAFLLSSGFEQIESPLTIDFLVTRHLVVKENNIVGPYTSVEVPTHFSFVFLHSSPERFVELCQELHRLALRPDVSAMEEIRKPMFHRPFDPSNLVDMREKPITSSTLQCSLIMPLQSKPGTAVVTTHRLYFQPAAGVLTPTETIAMTWPLVDMVAFARRYSGLKDCAVEIYLRDGTSVLLALEKQREREKIVRALPPGLCCHSDRSFVVEAAQQWQRGQLSNYDYLLALNSAAGRTFHDLSRYPVFPWVLADYSSDKLDLSNRASFRDMTRPMGALNEERLSYFQQRLESMADMEHPFLFGTHYSAPGYILYYLVRSMPEHMLCLQNGKFDAPDRMFYSIQNCYSCALTNHADVKELIPEFFNPAGGFDFLINARNLQLGATQHGDRVHDVHLPPWARSPRDFIKKNRKALESDICTEMLPAWIDLIFGYKARGEEALDTNNLFHPSAYLGPNDLERIESPQERAQAELHAVEFGIVPDQLFDKKPHPTKATPSFDINEFVSATLGKVDYTTESDGLTDGDYTAKQQGSEQAWELLESPSHGSTDPQEQEAAAVPKLPPVSSAMATSPDKKKNSTSSNHPVSSAMATSAGSAPPPSRVVSSATGTTLGFGGSSVAMYNKKLQKHISDRISPKPSRDEAEELATPVGKAKASWVPPGAMVIPPADTFAEEEASAPEAQPITFRTEQTHPALGVVASHDKQDVAAPRNIPLPLSGSGDMTRRAQPGTSTFGSHPSSSHHNNKTTSNRKPDGLPSQAQSSAAATNTNKSSAGTWDMKTIERKRVHEDAVTGCSLLLQRGPQNASLLVSVSLDSSLLVHTVSLGDKFSGGDADEFKLRGLTGTLSRIPYLGSLHQQQQSTVQSKINLHRTHTASDPLACLSMTSDGSGGELVFAGGHDDVVLAYGINSACAVASVYSHRDAVTGLDIIPRPAVATAEEEEKLVLWSDPTTTHIMVSGSWDATVKVWSIAVASGETVSINREPLAELFDADSTIVCLSATYIARTGIAIAAGCSDGSFVTWFCHDDGTKVVIHKEPPRRGGGPCAALQWASPSSSRGGPSSSALLFAGFSTGKVSSYLLEHGRLTRVSAVSVGVAVKCLAYLKATGDGEKQCVLLVGCADGGLRLLPLRDVAQFDGGKPILWPGVHEKNSALTTLSVMPMNPVLGKCVCASGAEDGSVAVFELKKVDDLI